VGATTATTGDEGEAVAPALVQDLERVLQSLQSVLVSSGESWRQEGTAYREDDRAVVEALWAAQAAFTAALRRHEAALAHTRAVLSVMRTGAITEVTRDYFPAAAVMFAFDGPLPLPPLGAAGARGCDARGASVGKSSIAPPSPRGVGVSPGADTEPSSTSTSASADTSASASASASTLDGDSDHTQPHNNDDDDTGGGGDSGACGTNTPVTVRRRLSEVGVQATSLGTQALTPHTDGSSSNSSSSSSSNSSTGSAGAMYAPSHDPWLNVRAYVRGVTSLRAVLLGVREQARNMTQTENALAYRVRESIAQVSMRLVCAYYSLENPPLLTPF